jgi:hypothetical protein
MRRKYSNSAKGALAGKLTWQVFLDRTNRQRVQQCIKAVPHFVGGYSLGRNGNFGNLLSCKKLFGGFYSGHLRARKI